MSASDNVSDKDRASAALTRREAIRRVSAMLGGVALVGQANMLAASSAESAAEPGAESAAEPATDHAKNALFSERDIALLDEIAETILPETDTPGAKAAEVGAFMALMVTDTYRAPDQAIFREGLLTIDARCRQAFGHNFLSASPEMRLSLLESLDKEQVARTSEKPADAPAHFFRMMKELALLGYFTSEIGYTKAMRYLETPARFDPCVDYIPGDKTWAAHA